jgi:hypothetical protein
MNQPQAVNVSVIDPITPAIERARTILFRPFDLGKWCVIGFCAWLAQLGSHPGGGNGARYNIQGEDIRRGFGEARDYVTGNLHWILPVGIVLLAVFIGVWLLLAWLSSHGRFTFLHCVAKNKAEVANPWRQFDRHANSLFAFRAILGLITIGAAVAALILGAIVASVSTAALGFNPLTIVGLVVAILFFVAIMIVSYVIGKFTNDFVAPIMYLHTNSAVAAWKILLDLLSGNGARFVLYLLVQIAITIVIATLIVMSACCSCCCAACLFSIPYVGTVILLPIHVFLRSYSLYYLAQYGRQFDVFEPSAAAT